MQGAHASEEPTAVGVWQHPDERIQVQIAPCGEHLCGKVVWLKNPNDETGLPRLDRENPVSAERDKPIVGTTVIQGLDKSGPGLWTDGKIYNPDDGKTYNARVTVVDADTMELRAYKLMPLFGETQVWTRVRP